MIEDNKQAPSRIPRGAARALALPRPAGLVLDWRFIDWRGWLSRQVAREIDQRRLFPWLAVCFGLGILLFFQAEGQPSLWAPLGAFSLCCAGAVTLRALLEEGAGHGLPSPVRQPAAMKEDHQ